MIVIGKTIEKYKIISELGEGGMGIVYLAEHVTLGKKYALKVLFQQLARKKDLRERFIRETQAQAALNHPSIVSVTDYIEYEGQHILVSEYIDGPTLSEYMQQKGKLSAKEILHIVEGPMDALNYVHSKGIIHRDLKPSNILIDNHGNGKLTDFGIALILGMDRMTQTGSSMGTPHYMSPEQALNPKGIDHRSDLYSIGCILYEMASGAPVFEGNTDYVIKEKHIKEKPLDLGILQPDLPGHFVSSVMKSLSKNPDDRFAGSGEMLNALKVDGLPMDYVTERRIIKKQKIAKLIVNELALRKSESIYQEVNYDVRLKVPLAVVGEAHKFQGRGTMKVNCEGLGFIFKSLIVTPDPYSVKWTDIHELKNRLRDKRFFKLNMGKNKEIIIRKVKVLKGNIDLLADLLDSLPDSCYSFQCPKCDGYVINDLCRKCGTKPSAMNRKEGVILLIIGMIIWLLLYFFRPVENPTLIHKGFGLIGLAAVIRGLYKIMLGKRI